ncbi:MAG: uracil-DNA glycosylase [Candidatus Staskawiczbacteria bacterium RIFCSPLOWO2_01_FULL_40_39]|uniref:Type-4 uracil-DNA glycosylase n=1 Tax=Candidatus Staskawiczbacteria bacterium RIFCSPHIGHO2_01_FULL_39_25 TaxID=1802202 RepID=A0A1G2HNT5_9BACT|nr:MAG: uracil-DNA glycosylase [Candidatus Staskawiczbacteria bacterium RIFCSPHIGHO2_01_FULL_39_25]OGZ73007.1 MAG: uracil-DNA glycosylase [Candidatus Staskawiczbacteria bacterium RIFCSPLOWO2_01_FULL_40_39]OGZ76255.1 MAG: uracil-DNA glycosylase [Candidatus Staskawiczbacteria bacterium RIFCSPLOWO2_02_FULL_39_8]
MEESRTELLRQIKNEVINLKESSLYKFRIENKVFPVIGEGSHEAEIMFIGEAPGKNEAATGRPFCGAAGRVLTELIESIGLNRKEVYITNIVKDRPPDNRDPLPEEIRIYSPFLDRQIDIIQPKIIATLGRYSMAYVMEKFSLQNELKSISQIHGKVFDAKASYGEIKVIPLYHPAVALYQNSLKEQMFKDFKVIKSFYGK